ncbi:MAG: hypothetical protein ACI9GW_002778 [Halieaceae bacterium]|jgi:hypothetical protein
MKPDIERRVPSKLLHLLGTLGLVVSATVFAQVAPGNSDYSSPAYSDVLPLRSAAELESLVGPVALYPDDLLAVVLPAATYPLEIVQAARFLEQFEQDSTLSADESWDDSVVALLNYPEVLKMMNEDIDWTWKLGEAVVAQQSAVVAAVESFRDRALAAGNLQSDEHQTVSRVDDVIEIQPADKEVIYVPYYEPERVVEYSPYPVYHYYPRAYPLYYYPYASNYHFGSGFFWGVSTAFSIGWSSDYLHVYHYSYRGHPYYGHAYGGQRYRHASISVHNNHYVNNHRRKSHDSHRSGDYWRPRHASGARPGKYSSHKSYYSQNDHRPSRLKDNHSGGSAGGHSKSNTTLAFRERGANNMTGVSTSRQERRDSKALRHSTDSSSTRRGHSNDMKLRGRETRVESHPAVRTRSTFGKNSSGQHRSQVVSGRQLVSASRKGPATAPSVKSHVKSGVKPEVKSEVSKPARQHRDKPSSKAPSVNRTVASRASHQSRTSAVRQERRQRR